MNLENVGKYIKKLREKNNWSQEDLAKKVFVTRQAVSSWETGKYLPDLDKLKLLSEIFNVNIIDIYAGKEIKDNKLKNNYLYDLIKIENNKILKKLKALLVIFFIMIMGFLSYYFISSYKSIKVYIIDMKKEEFTINGIFMISKDKSYFNLNVDGIEVDNLSLTKYPKEPEGELLYNVTNSNKIIFRDLNGYDKYFSYKEINNLINNLYLTIDYNNNYKAVKKTIKLDLKKDFENSKFLFTKYKNEDISNTFQKYDIPKNILDQFEYANDNSYYLFYKVDNCHVDITYTYDVEKLIVKETYIENDTNINYIENWNFNISTKILKYKKIDNLGNIIYSFEDNIFNKGNEKQKEYFKANYINRYLSE